MSETKNGAGRSSEEAVSRGGYRIERTFASAAALRSGVETLERCGHDGCKNWAIWRLCRGERTIALRCDGPLHRLEIVDAGLEDAGV